MFFSISSKMSSSPPPFGPALIRQNAIPNITSATTNYTTSRQQINSEILPSNRTKKLFGTQIQSSTGTPPKPSGGKRKTRKFRRNKKSYSRRNKRRKSHY